MTIAMQSATAAHEGWQTYRATPGYTPEGYDRDTHQFLTKVDADRQAGLMSSATRQVASTPATLRFEGDEQRWNVVYRPCH